MEKPVFVYWDCFEAYYKLDFKNIFKLAVANRTVKHVVLCGSIALELLWICNQLPAKLDTCPYNHKNNEKNVLRSILLHMLRDCLDNQESPGTAVLVTSVPTILWEEIVGLSLSSVLEKMLGAGWSVEVLLFSAKRICPHNWEMQQSGMKQWSIRNGVCFISLGECYKYNKSITFVEPGYGQPPRPALPLDLSERPIAGITLDKQEDGDPKN